MFNPVCKGIIPFSLKRMNELFLNKKRIMLELTNILKRTVSPEVSRIRTSSFMKICQGVNWDWLNRNQNGANPDLCARGHVCVWKLAYGNSLLIKIADSNILSQWSKSKCYNYFSYFTVRLHLTSTCHSQEFTNNRAVIC